MRLIKAGETNADQLKVYFDIRLLDNISPALGETGGQPQLSINGNTFSNNGIFTLTLIGFGQYFALLDGAYLLVPGDILIPRYQGITTAESRAEPIQVIDPATYIAPQSATPIQYYGSTVNGDIFFSQRLDGSSWESATPQYKIRALTMATQAIDRLNFCGDKTDPAQILQFPRKNISFLFPSLSADNNSNSFNNYVQIFADNTDVVPTVFTSDYGVYLESQDSLIPNDIEVAAYLCANKFLDGYDPDVEIINLMAIQNKQGNAVTMYDRSFIPEFIKAGIPSATAWAYLRPYLRNPYELDMLRAT